MIKLSYDGYIFISDSGIEYDLLEGVTMGRPERYTSDKIFIILNDFRYEEQHSLVGYLWGASHLKDSIEVYNDHISELVNSFESSHQLKKKGGA